MLWASSNIGGPDHTDPDERKSRAITPHPGRRIGLLPALPKRHRTLFEKLRNWEDNYNHHPATPRSAAKHRHPRT